MFIDLTGKRFGHLLVVRRVENRSGNPRWLCRCDCGNDHVTFGYMLRSGRSRSCRCATPYGKLIDLTGQRFGRWTVVRRKGSYPAPDKSSRWLCRCDCGRTRLVGTRSLRTGDSRSCGCARRYQANRSPPANRKKARQICDAGRAF